MSINHVIAIVIQYIMFYNGQTIISFTLWGSLVLMYCKNWGSISDDEVIDINCETPSIAMT